MENNGAVLKQAEEIVTFNIDEDVFGIRVEHVVEVNRDLMWTPISGASAVVLGAANLRGNVITIMDMRMILECEESSETEAATVVIIQSKDELIGVVVDHIADVIRVDPDQVEKPPMNIPVNKRRLLSGVVKGESGLVGLLDLEIALA